MRHCFNDHPEVFEETNEDLSALLREVANEVDKTETSSFSAVNIDFDTESAEYRATLYVH